MGAPVGLSGFGRPPAAASWRFAGARRGGERVRLVVDATGVRAVGLSRGVDLDEGIPWRVRYDVRWDHRWMLRSAVVRTAEVTRVVRRDADGWTIDGVERPGFGDCADLDLQASLLTNTAPVRRAAGRRRAVSASAVYLTSTLDVERLDQTYRRRPGAGWEYDYDSPVHGYGATLRFDADGLVREYPFLGRRT